MPHDEEALHNGGMEGLLSLLGPVIGLCAVRKLTEKFLVLGVERTMQFSGERDKLRIISGYAMFRHEGEHVIRHGFAFISL